MRSQGAGEFGLNTGIGVGFPFGGVGIRRDLWVAVGGEGRIGGRPFSFG